MIDFPASPTDGQIFSATNGVVYKWSATYSSWLAQNPAPAIGGTGDFSGVYTSPDFGIVSAGQVLGLQTILSGNSGGWFNLGTSRYTPPAGRFYIWGALTCFSSVSATGFNLRILKNGAAVQTMTTSAATSVIIEANVSGTFDANGSDYFQLSADAGVNFTGRLVSFGAFPLTGLQGPTGPAGVTQTVVFETGAVATGTTVIPFGDTIPTNTQGDQYMTLAITPQSATSKLIIDVVAHLFTSATGAGAMAAALFQDATANALATAFCSSSPTSTSLLNFRHTMTSGTTSATTFKVRAGFNVAGTTTFNGQNGTRAFGGTLASSIVIREVP